MILPTELIAKYLSELLNIPGKNILKGYAFLYFVAVALDWPRFDHSFFVIAPVPSAYAISKGTPSHDGIACEYAN